MIRLVGLYLPTLFLVTTALYLAFSPHAFTSLQSVLLLGGSASYVGYVILLIIAVVFAPVTIMPVIPLAAAMFGPFITGVLSVIGWTIGSSIAFLISRYLGRPIVERYIQVSRIDDILDRFPSHMHFWLIVLLRHTIPVDLLSYALGLTKSLGFRTYFFATLVGVSYFSFAFAYAGEAFFTGNLFMLFEILLASITIFGLGWYLISHKLK